VSPEACRLDTDGHPTLPGRRFLTGATGSSP